SFKCPKRECRGFGDPPRFGIKRLSLGVVSAELIQNMVSKDCHWTRDGTVHCLHESKKVGMTRYPRLGCAGWHGDTNTETLLKDKPLREGAKQCRTAMIDDMEIVVGKACWGFAVLKTSQRQMRSPSKHFRHHLPGAKSSENNQHRY